MSGLVEARVNAAVEASVSGATHMQLHTADPGAAGTIAVAAGTVRQTVAWQSVSAQAKSGTASFVIPGPGGPFTHVSLWTASTGGTFYGSATVNPAEAFAGAGNLGVTVTVAGQSS